MSAAIMLGAFAAFFAKEKAGKAKSPISDFLGVQVILIGSIP